MTPSEKLQRALDAHQPPAKKAPGKPGAPRGNRNAAKAQPKTAWITAACHERDKARWEAVAKAQGISRSAWIVRALNDAAAKQG